MFALAVTNVGSTVGIGLKTGATSSGWGGSGRGRWSDGGGSPTSAKATPSLALLRRSARARAYADVTKGRAACGLAVCVAQALARDKLFAFAVTDVGSTIGVWSKGRSNVEIVVSPFVLEI